MEKIYHYTSAAALTSILNTGYLRATHARYLADGSECRHAINLIRNLEPRLNESKLWKSVEETLLSQPRYVCCFSLVRDDPHQWEHYAGQGSGACIVLDRDKLVKLNPAGVWDNFTCNYNQNEQQKRLRSLATEIMRRGDDAIGHRVVDFWKMNIKFKCQEFSKENEVRFVFNPQKDVYLDQESVVLDPEVRKLVGENNEKLGNFSHPSGLFDEKFRPFESFPIYDAICQVDLGSHFTSTLSYFEFLKNNYTISQHGTVYARSRNICSQSRCLL